MENVLPTIETLTEKTTGDLLLAAHDYWFKRRLFFNLIVGAVGLCSTILFATSFSAFDIMGILMWGIVANGLYSLGYALESYAIIKHPAVKLYKLRALLFWTGTLLYAAFSFLFAYNYYLSSGIAP